MKVCMAYPFTFPGFESWEGSRSRLLSLSRGLVERGVEVHVLGGEDKSYHRGSLDGIRLHRYRRRRRAGRLLLPLTVGDEVRRLASTLRIDIVHSHLPVVASSVALWKPFIGSRILFDTHDWFKLHDEVYYNLPSTPRALSRPVNFVERMIAERHDGVLVVTPLLLPLVGRRARPFVVPNAVDTDLFRPRDSAYRAGLKDERATVVGFLGFVSVHQGFLRLLEAIKLLSERPGRIRLLAVGGGFIDEARARAKALGIDDLVTFTGPDRVPYQQVPDLINAMDVAVSPLQPEPIYHQYAQPLKVLEYMACGVPVVATPLPEQSRLILEAKGGKVARGFGAAEVAEAILELMGSAEKLRGGGHARDYVVSNHSPGTVIGRLLDAYRGLC